MPRGHKRVVSEGHIHLPSKLAQKLDFKWRWILKCDFDIYETNNNDDNDNDDVDDDDDVQSCIFPGSYEDINPFKLL